MCRNTKVGMAVRPRDTALVGSGDAYQRLRRVPLRAVDAGRLKIARICS